VVGGHACHDESASAKPQQRAVLLLVGSGLGRWPAGGPACRRRLILQGRLSIFQSGLIETTSKIDPIDIDRDVASAEIGTTSPRPTLFF
jgi:hypothetical protein